MARSRKKEPIAGSTIAESEKAFKTLEHQRHRAAVRGALSAGDEPPPPRDFGNPWHGPKDGKRYYHVGQERLRRK